ncbi:MAG: TonB-dependent receptor [Myxococcota bacterium]
MAFTFAAAAPVAAQPPADEPEESPEGTDEDADASEASSDEGEASSDEGEASSDESAESEEPRVRPPTIAEFVEATYPSEAEEQGLEATVELEITIAVDGAVTDARVITPVGNGFDEAAVDAVRRFRFTPAIVNGQPTSVRIRYRYVFELRRPDPEPEPDVPEPPARGSFAGRVLGLEDNEPIARVEVVVTSADETTARRAVSDEDGRFQIEELPAGTYRVRVVADEYGELEQEEEIGSGEITEVVYRMRIQSTGDQGNAFGATAIIDPPPREVVRRTIAREALTRIPGTRGDALRAIEILPGVARPAFGAGELIIRGSAPGDSEILLEGVPIPLLYHFGGLTSVINSRLLDRIDFFPGNFSSRYGRRMGGIVEVDTRDPLSIHDDRSIHGVLEFGVIDTSILLEFPLGEDASQALAFRRSLIDIVFEQVVPDDFNVVAAPVYYDYQAFTTWRPTERDRFRLLIYGSSDRFKLILPDAFGDDPAVRGDVDLRTRFNNVQVAYDRQIDENTELDIDVQGGPIFLDFALGEDIGFEARFNQLYSRVEVRHRPNRRVRLIAGVDMFLVPFVLEYQGPPPRQSEGDSNDGPLARENQVFVDIRDVAVRPGFYVESDMRLLDEWQVLFALRADYDREIDRFVFDPRVLTTVDATDFLRLKAAVGLYSQPPEFQESAEEIGNPNLDWIHSVHVGGGFDLRFAEGARIGVDGFYKRLWDRVVSTEGGVDPIFDNAGIGRIYGAEFSARIDPIRGRKYFGFISYTLSRSERRDRPGERWRLFDFDQTHIFNAAFVYKLPRNWEVGATLRLVSGNPMTPVVGSVYDAVNDVYVPVNGELNSRRNPLFNRLDLRVEKKWVFSSWRLAFFLDIQNVYNQQNQEGLIYNYNYEQSTPINGLPLIPAIGLRGEL